MIKELANINLWNWLILFTSYLALDVLYTKNMLYTYRLEALKSANVGVVIYILSIYGTVSFIDNLWNMVPILVGSWIGTYGTLKWEQRQYNKEQKKKKHA